MEVGVDNDHNNAYVTYVPLAFTGREFVKFEITICVPLPPPQLKRNKVAIDLGEYGLEPLFT